MNVKNIIKCLFSGVVLAFVVSACNNKIEPLEVVAPTIPVDSEALTTYKSSLFSRPIVMGFLTNWKATNGIMLASTPDSLDVVVVCVDGYEITEAMKLDMTNVIEEKQTSVLLRTDINSIDNKYAKDLKKEMRAKRKELKAGWTEDQMPTPEEQETLFAELENQIKEKYVSAANKEALNEVNSALEAMTSNQFSGLCLKLPESFSILTEEGVINILNIVVAKCGGTQQPFLAVETPFEAGREQIEKATWVIYNRQTIEKRLSYFTEEAVLWSNSRYLPSVDISKGDDAKGFFDSGTFTIGNPMPCREEVISWKAPNRAGVAYYSIEVDANYNEDTKDTYPEMRRLINLVGITK